MDELIKTFHIDWRLILAQLLNFFIVLYVLKRFAYQPLLKLMDDRTERIEKGLRDAEGAQKKLAEMEEKEKEVLATARKEAHKIISESEKVAIKSKEEIVVQAKEQAENILAEAEKKIKAEKDIMISEVKTQIAELVIAATGKMIDEKLDSEKDKILIEKSIE